MVKSANRMATAGLLVRKPDPADARLVRLYLTDRARSVRRAIEQERDELEQRMTATLTSAEREHLRSALTKIIDQLAGDQARPSPRRGAWMTPKSYGFTSDRASGRESGAAPGAGTRAQRGPGQRRPVQPG